MKRCLLLTMLMVAGCQPKLVRESPPLSPLPTTAVVRGAMHYRIDSSASELYILVYRAGPMARFGHNHVLSAENVSGDVFLHADLARSQVSLSLPVAELNVDDPQARAKLGEEFAAAVPQEVREGTRRNVLRAEVLDAARFPVITLQSIAIGGTRNAPQLTVRIAIKDVARDVPVLATVKESNAQLIATGEFDIQQSEFGITPFSVAMGALQVQDRLRIKFSIVSSLVSSLVGGGQQQ